MQLFFFSFFFSWVVFAVARTEYYYVTEGTLDPCALVFLYFHSFKYSNYIK